MKTINSWRDLEAFGITPLTYEACGLSYRLLCDVTEAGKRIIEQCLDAKLELTEPWNRGAVGSIMLAPELLLPLGIFALLETGCTEVWRNGESLVGLTRDDTDETRQKAPPKRPPPAPGGLPSQDRLCRIGDHVTANRLHTRGRPELPYPAVIHSAHLVFTTERRWALLSPGTRTEFAASSIGWRTRRSCPAAS